MRDLKVGRINYLNLFPIFNCLEEDKEAPPFNIIDGVPSSLNRLLRDGRIEISPSSSIEYLRNREIYEIIEGHSISSFGAIRSILLFSKKTIEELDGEKVLTSSQSETSVVLLDVILRRFYGHDVELIPSECNLPDALQQSPACLLIGDDALIWRKRLTGSIQPYIYDLGEIWFRNTGLPFVFALWIVRKDALQEMKEEISLFKEALNRAKAKALLSLEHLSSLTPLSTILSEEEIISYWRQISFDLGEDHIKGLELFDRFRLTLP